MSLRLRPEFLTDVTCPVAGFASTGVGQAQEIGLVNRIPLDKPIYALNLELAYRIATGATTTGVTQAEAGQNFIQRVRVVGTHKVYGQRELTNLRGATLWELSKKYAFGQSPQLISNLPAAGVAPAINSPFDVKTTIYVPLVPQGIPKSQQVLFLVRNDEWSTFDLYITFGDATAVFKFNAGQVVTFSNFGSGTGLPTVHVTAERVILGSARALVQPAIFRRYFLSLSSALTSSNLSDSPIQDLDVGYKVHSYLVKVGIQDTTTTGGVFAFASLSDAVLTRPKVKLDNVVQKDAITPFTARAYSANYFGAPMDVGYAPLEFVEGHDVNTAFRGDMLNRSNKLQLAGDVTATANSFGEVVQEIMEGEPNIYKPAGAGAQK